jgi:hypothetical protein
MEDYRPKGMKVFLVLEVPGASVAAMMPVKIDQTVSRPETERIIVMQKLDMAMMVVALSKLGSSEVTSAVIAG